MVGSYKCQNEIPSLDTLIVSQVIKNNSATVLSAPSYLPTINVPYL
jgi:hypothetical protein